MSTKMNLFGEGSVNDALDGLGSGVDRLQPQDFNLYDQIYFKPRTGHEHGIPREAKQLDDGYYSMPLWAFCKYYASSSFFDIPVEAEIKIKRNS